VALLVRLPLMTRAHEAYPGGDSAQYILLGSQFFSDGQSDPSSAVRPPGYPLFLALTNLLPGRIEDNGAVVQLLIGSVLAGAIVYFAWSIFGAFAAVATGLLVALAVPNMELDALLLSDGLFGILVCACCAVLIAAVLGPDDRRQVRLLLLLGAFVAAATYVKPVGHALILAPIVPLALATRSLRQTVTGVAIVAGVVVVATVPWMARNAAQYGSFSMSVQSGATLFARVFERDRLPPPLDRPYGRRLQEFERRHPDVRLSSGFHGELRGLGLSATDANGVQRDLALTALEREPLTVAGGVVESVAGTYADVAGDSRYGRDVMDSIVREDEGAISPKLTALGLGIGEALRGLWFLVSIAGFAAILWFVTAGRRAQVAASCVVAVWFCVALATAVLHGGTFRYSASLAPLVWLFGALGAATVLRVVAQFVAPPWRDRLLAVTTRGLAPRKVPRERQPTALG
jgi:dolichyl-phosphate-mannose-protein mannosyltransferase